MAASLAIAVALGLFLQRTRYGRILRATAENREMAEALGADVTRIYAGVFTLGTVLGTVGGALVVPTAAASLDMPVELVVEAFAVVVIGGLGSMRGALVGALIVGLMRALAITFYAELEVLAIYLIVIAVLIARPAGPVRKAGRMTAARSHAGAASGSSPRRSSCWRVLPSVAEPYYVTLVLPAFAYAIALLGFNLLFGTTGLLSFGHALFVAIGAYAAAVLTSKLGVQQLRADRARRRRRVGDRRDPGRAARVRYVRIFFGILTLAFGMLFHSFLFKFYDLTGGDTGIRVLRPTLLGQEWKELDKTAFLIGPFYYSCLLLAVVARLRHVAHRPLAVRPASGGDPRERAQGRVPGRAGAPLPPGRVPDLGVLRRRRRRDPGRQHRPGRSRAGLLDAFRRARLHDRARRLRQLLRPAGRRLRVHLPASRS